MKVTASEVASYIIAEFHASEDLITNMKVQKLLYYVQGWHLGLYGIPVFADEFQAWVHGPVQYEVWKEYQGYSGGPITNSIEEPRFEQHLIKHIEQVLECYGGETAFTLELMTHKEWPWIEARNDLPSDVPSQNIILIETMKEYFTKLVQDNEKNHNYTLNQETIKALEESRRGIGIQSFSSLEELYKDLGI